jgi:hypothetical protein
MVQDRKGLPQYGENEVVMIEALLDVFSLI